MGKEEKNQLNNPPTSYGIGCEGLSKEGVKITFPTSGCVTLTGSTGAACAGGVAPAVAQPPTPGSVHRGQGRVGCQHCEAGVSPLGHHCYKSPVAVSIALRALAAVGFAAEHWPRKAPQYPRCLPDCRPLLWHGTSGMARCPTRPQPPPSLPRCTSFVSW